MICTASGMVLNNQRFLDRWRQIDAMAGFVDVEYVSINMYVYLSDYQSELAARYLLLVSGDRKEIINSIPTSSMAFIYASVHSYTSSTSRFTTSCSVHSLRCSSPSPFLTFMKGLAR